MPLALIAECRQLGTSEAAVKMQVKRAFEKLRTLLAGATALLLLTLHSVQ